MNSRPERNPRSYGLLIAGSEGLRIKFWARQETMAKLVEDLSSYLNRAVFDRTGLQGHYDFTLDSAMDTAGGGIPRAGPTLGLRLDQKKGSVEVLIVDGADRLPTAN